MERTLGPFCYRPTPIAHECGRPYMIYLTIAQANYLLHDMLVGALMEDAEYTALCEKHGPFSHPTDRPKQPTNDTQQNTPADSLRRP